MDLYQQRLANIRRNGEYIKYVKEQEQTPELCLEAVKQNGWALQFVKNQTYDVCLEAIRQNGLALRFASRALQQDPEVILAASR